MITADQQKWLDHLSEQDRVVIKPFDPTAAQKFETVRQKILNVLGSDTQVEHRGATSLGISGQDEIDVYIPVPERAFEGLIEILSTAFGKPRSHYPFERARFVLVEAGKHVDIFLINAQGPGWLNGVRFENYLKAHAEALEAYRLLKEAGDGLSVKEYYRRKTEFINTILQRADQEKKNADPEQADE